MKRTLAFLSFAMICGLLIPSVPAQKIDCGKAASSNEQAQCADQELAAADADLKDAFADALRQYSQTNSKGNGDASLPKEEAHEQAQYNAKMRGALIASQRAWRQYRVAACNSVAVMYDGGTITASSVPFCQAALARERARFLRNYFGQNH